MRCKSYLKFEFKYKLIITMKILKLILLLSIALSFNTNYALNNSNAIESLHAHDVKISVFVKMGGQLLSGATSKVFIYGREVATGTSNEVGKIDLLVKSYTLAIAKLFEGFIILLF